MLPEAAATVPEIAAAHDVEAVADRIHERLAAVLPVDDRTDDIAVLLLRVPSAD